MISLKKIMVPTDFSVHSERALRYGVELAKKFGAELHLFHSIDPAPIMYGEGFGALPDDTRALFDTATKHLHDVKILGAEDVPITRTITEGRVSVEVVRYAKENAIDLIVIGRHGRGFIAHLLLGSTTEKVLRSAPCPVLTVRAEEREFVVP